MAGGNCLRIDSTEHGKQTIYNVGYPVGHARSHDRRDRSGN